MDANPAPGTAPRRGEPASRRPPRWLPRALLLAVVAVYLGLFGWYAIGTLQDLAVNVLIAFFLTLALDPIVVWCVRHGWRRRLAAATALGGSLVAVALVLALFGNLFVQQLVQLLGTVPTVYADFQDLAAERFGVTVPDSDDLVRDVLTRFGDDVATGAWLFGTSVIGGLFALLTVLLVTYYLLAAGPRFRAAVCAWLTPERQQEVLTLWEITQVKVSDFINSRIVLAALSSAFTLVFLLILRTPYALPLAVFVGVVSQFVPTIGTYLGGALPIVVALTSQGLAQGVAVLAFVVAYQQLENLYFSPKVSARALEMNPAVSFLAVLAFGALFGALGAFLALPVAATIQATANTYLRRHTLIESRMLRDPGRWTAVEGDGGRAAR